MTMKAVIAILCTLYVIQIVVGPPVTQKKNDEKPEDNEINDTDNLEPLGIEYSRYLKEVVTALESDPDFRRKLERAEEADIRTGKIAQELEYVNHQVRTKLDELKRQELERLRHLAIKEYELRNGIDTDHLKIPPEHLDHSNPNTFEIEDLRKLISKTTADLAAADKKRREEFKEYEMQKEFEKQEKLRNLDEEHKKQLQKEIEEKEKQHKTHEPLHHPGSKQQLEEVWQKQDHMENQDFDPKTFFYLHDLDGNGVWDEQEVKALFLKELDKLYKSGAPEADMRERVEEMERMREHVFSETDTNKDGLISYAEFLAQTLKPDFEKDQGWEGLDEQRVFTEEEYREFERQRQESVRRMIAEGLIPPHPNGMPPPPGSHQPVHHAQQFGSQHQPQQYHPGGQFQPQGQVPPGQMPHGYTNQGQIPQGHIPPHVQVPQGQIPQGHLQQGQIPQGHLQQGQIPQGHLQQGQIPQGHLQQGQIPQGHLQQGQIPQGHLQQGQITQGHLQQGQIPQGHLQQGRIPQGHLQQGQIAQGYMPQGQVPQGYIQQGQVPPGHIPQGQVPPSHIQQAQIPQSYLPQGNVPQGQVPQEQPPQAQVPLDGDQKSQVTSGHPNNQISPEGSLAHVKANVDEGKQPPDPQITQTAQEKAYNQVLSNSVNNESALDKEQDKASLGNLKEAVMKVVPPMPVIHPRQPSRRDN